MKSAINLKLCTENELAIINLVQMTLRVIFLSELTYRVKEYYILSKENIYTLSSCT